MSVNEDSFQSLIDFSKLSDSEFSLTVDDKTYLLNGVDIANSPTPVNKPTTRGGVYFSDKFAYKMKGTIQNLDVVPLLTKKMLGPNTEFKGLDIIAKTKFDGSVVFELLANLTNSVQSPDSIQLNMIIINLKTL